MVRKYAYQARLEDVTVHTFRHSFAKNLVDAGTKLDQAATLLDYDRLGKTRIYTQPSERDLERAVHCAAGESARDDGMNCSQMLRFGSPFLKSRLRVPSRPLAAPWFRTWGDLIGNLDATMTLDFGYP